VLPWLCSTESARDVGFLLLVWVWGMEKMPVSLAAVLQALKHHFRGI